MKKAVIYTRVSTYGQAEEGTSLEAQELTCLRKAAELGAQVVGTFTDAGVSGSFYAARPGIQQALRAIEGGQADTLIIAKVDRAARDVEIIRDIRRRVERAKGRLIYADGMNFEDNAMGRLMETQIGGFAEFEKAVIKERTAKGRNDRARQGITPGRAASPYGYIVPTHADILRGTYPADQLGRYLIDERTAEWVRAIFAEFAAGRSLRQLCAWLCSQGVPTPKNGRYWQHSTLKHILTNPVYKGEAGYGKREYGTDERRLERGFKDAQYCCPREEGQWITIPCPALVTEEVWDACQRRLQENRNALSGNPKHRYLLSGFMRCPTCGRAMIGHTGSRWRYYHCRVNRARYSGTDTCNSRHYRADMVDRMIIDAINELSHSGDRVEDALRAFQKSRQSKTYDPGIAARLRAELDALDREEAAAVRAQVEAIAKGRSADAYERLLDEIEDKRTALKKRLAAQEQQAEVPSMEPKTDAETLAQVLSDVKEALNAPEEDMPLEEKRIILSHVIKCILPDEAEGYYLLDVSWGTTVQRIQKQRSGTNSVPIRRARGVTP